MPHRSSPVLLFLSLSSVGSRRFTLWELLPNDLIFQWPHDKYTNSGASPRAKGFGNERDTGGEKRKETTSLEYRKETKAMADN